MSIIRMEYHLYDEIVRHAKANLPEEACGLLAGKVEGECKTVQKVYFLENTDHAEDHFTMDPKEQLQAVKDMRSKGSEEDIKLAYDSKASYTIISLMAENPVYNSFHIENGEYEKEDLRIYSDEYWF